MGPQGYNLLSVTGSDTAIILIINQAIVKNSQVEQLLHVDYL